MSRRVFSEDHELVHVKCVPRSKWQSDKAVQVCPDCEGKFTFFERRHHCRPCGKVFCDYCTPKNGITLAGEVVRTCHRCLDKFTEKKQKRKDKRQQKKDRLLAERLGKLEVGGDNDDHKHKDNDNKVSDADDQAVMALAYARKQRQQAVAIEQEKREPVPEEDLYKRVEFLEEDQWQPDEEAKQCNGKECKQTFTVKTRKHHCRVCGFVFCGKCCPKEELTFEQSVRFCKPCLNKYYDGIAHRKVAELKKKAKAQAMLKERQEAAQAEQEEGDESE